MSSKTSPVFVIPALFMAAYIGTNLGEIFYPFKGGTIAVLVNEEYFRVVHRYYLLLGVVAGTAVASVGFLTRARLGTQLFVLLSWGALYSLWHQAGEPDFLQFAVAGTIEFLAPYSLGSIPIIGLVSWLLSRAARTSDKNNIG